MVCSFKHGGFLEKKKHVGVPWGSRVPHSLHFVNPVESSSCCEIGIEIWHHMFYSFLKCHVATNLLVSFVYLKLDPTCFWTIGLDFLAILAVTPMILVKPCPTAVAGFGTGAAEQPSTRSGGVAAADSSFSMAEGRMNG